MTEGETNDLLFRISVLNDQNAFKGVYVKYYSKLIGLCETFIRNKNVCEEIVDDVLLNLWLNRKSLLKIQNLTVYLYVAVKNKSLTHLSREQRRRIMSLEEITMDIKDVDVSPIEKIAGKEFTQMVNKIILGLPPKSRLIFKLVKDDGLKYRDVAAILEISQKTVEYHIGLALKCLAENLPFITDIAFKKTLKIFQVN